MRLKIYFLIGLLLMFSTVSVAQEDLNNSDFSEIKQTTKFDEFGDIGEKEFAPKLTKFLVLLRKSGFQGYVIFYGKLNDTPFRRTKFFADRKIHNYSGYLSREYYDSPRITYIVGGLHEEMKTELWLVPPGGERPEITNSGELIKDARYRLELLSSKQIDFNYEVLYRDSEGTESETEIESIFNDIAEDLTKVLSRDKTWRGVLIFYANKDEYDIEEFQKAIEETLQPYVENSKLDLSRVKIVFGGYRTIPEIETWIVNKNGIEPEPMPDEKFEAEN